MGQPILSVEHLQVCYTGKPVLEDVSLTLLPGQILGIVGESGSGKSTLIRAAMGLLGSDGAVTGGSIRYKDKNVRGLKGKNCVNCGDLRWEWFSRTQVRPFVPYAP